MGACAEPTISSTVIGKAPCEGSESLATNSRYRARAATMSGSGGGAVRRLGSETFIVPIASCLRA
jgi:hypothetical protein